VSARLGSNVDQLNEFSSLVTRVHGRQWPLSIARQDSQGCHRDINEFQDL